MSNPYRDHTPQETPAPATPTLWKLRVWWASLFVKSKAGDKWRIRFKNIQGQTMRYASEWDVASLKNIAERCENTPAGEPAPLPYYRWFNPETGITEDGVDFIHPAQVPTVARLARQAADCYERLTPAP